MLTKYNNICVICGRPKQDIHHLVFGRGLRELADEDNLTAPLCRMCHDEIHNNGVASGLSKIVGQLLFEMEQVKKGVPQETAREQFRKRYGRSYL
jgi:ribosomal protein S14